MPFQGNGWRPTRVTRFIRAFGTATRTVLVETDCGDGYLKALGNPEGPHVLACELVGSMLADWLGLSTLDFSILEVQEEDKIPFLNGGTAESGPAFISKSEPSQMPWGGAPKDLKYVANRCEISGLIVLDTWVLNCDRYSPDGRRRNLDNVFLVQQPGRRSSVRLVAADLTHAFTCGAEITQRIQYLERMRDERVYGCFPEFKAYLDQDRAYVRGLAARLGEFVRAVAEEFIGMVPARWELSREVRSAWATMITGRAHFLAEHIEQILWPQMELTGGTE